MPRTLLDPFDAITSITSYQRAHVLPCPRLLCAQRRRVPLFCLSLAPSLNALCISASAVDVGVASPAFPSLSTSSLPGGNTLPLPCLRLFRRYHLHLPPRCLSSRFRPSLSCLADIPSTSLCALCFVWIFRVRLCRSSLWLPRLLLGPRAPPSPALSPLRPAGVVSAPPSPLVGGPVCNLRVHLQNLLDCVLLASSVALVYLSASERVTVGVHVQQALTGFNRVCGYINSRQFGACLAAATAPLGFISLILFKTTRQRHNISRSLSDLFALKIKILGVIIILLLLEMCSCGGCGSESYLPPALWPGLRAREP